LHNCEIWGSENPRVSLEHVHHSPKVNVFCDLSKEGVYGPLLLHGDDYYQQFLISQTDEDNQEGRIHFHQDGTPLHYLGEVREYLNTRFPGRWIEGAEPIAWPLRSPVFTPLDFFLVGFIKDRVFVPSLPTNIVELRTGIIAAVAEVTSESLCST
jgi:hypothetical protein